MNIELRKLYWNAGLAECTITRYIAEYEVKAASTKDKLMSLCYENQASTLRLLLTEIKRQDNYDRLTLNKLLQDLGDL